MTQFLPHNLLTLFAARDPIPYLPPIAKLPYQKNTTGYSGIADFINQFEDPSETPPKVKIETREERLERKQRAKAELAAYKLEQELAVWDPHENPFATSDPRKTLFVARINYDTAESKLKREFEQYGNIKQMIMVHDKISGKSRGYAFIEYEQERYVKSAYKSADGKKIDGRRVVVDVERGRNIQGWLPRRLGGGLGDTRRGDPDSSVKHSGRDAAVDDRYPVGRDRVSGRDRERRRSRSRERRRRSTSRTRDRHHGDRHRRNRSRDRRDDDAGERRRSRSRDRKRRRSRERRRDSKRVKEDPQTEEVTDENNPPEPLDGTSIDNGAEGNSYDGYERE